MTSLPGRASLRVALESDVPQNDGEIKTLLANAATWLSKQPRAKGSSTGSITLSALNKVYGSFSGSALADTKTRKGAFRQFGTEFVKLPEKDQVPVAVALGRAAKGGVNFLRSSGP